jgi:hypothetical protein
MCRAYLNLNLLAIAPSTALSRSASLNTIKGALPPSSIDTCTYITLVTSIRTNVTVSDGHTKRTAVDAQALTAYESYCFNN